MWTYHSVVLQGGSLPGAIVSQEWGDLILVEVEAEAIDGGTRASGEHLNQLLDAYPQLQAHWIGLKQKQTCQDKAVQPLSNLKLFFKIQYY